MKILIIIPARYGSTRFPGKPLHVIAGKSMLERVWRIAKAVERVDEVYITTEDSRIIEQAERLGAKTLLTPESCRNGTERCHASINLLHTRPDVVINLQGDAALTPPWILQALVDAFYDDPDLAMATPAVRLTWEQAESLGQAKKTTPASGTLVTFDDAHRALYFSKLMIPFVRKPDLESVCPYFRHIGLYGYRADILDKLISLPPSPLEQAESLEQLRALENGIPIHVVEVDYQGRSHWSVDSPEDVKIVEDLIAQEGELV